MRRIAPFALLLFVATTACPPPQNQGEAAAGLVTEADSLRCGGRATIYTNHTNNPRDLHVRVKNGCDHIIMPETLIAGAARLVVLDGRNQVVQGQDVSIMSGMTHRGTMTVPGGARLQVECSTVGARGGCTWTYQYGLP